MLLRQLFLMYIHNPPPLFLPESLVLSKRCVVKHASSIAGSGMDECSHVSVMSRTQQSLVKLSQVTWSLSSFILLARDLTFAREWLGSGGLCGRFRNLASPPALHPRFCLRSLRRLCFLIDIVIHGEPASLVMNSGMLNEREDSAVTLISHKTQICNRLCQL